VQYQLHHARALAGASGLQCRVWWFYAWVDGRHARIMPDEKLAIWLGCDRSALSRARKRLVDGELLCPIGNRIHRKMYKVPDWAKGDS
jgi:hypothetical protein